MSEPPSAGLPRPCPNGGHGHDALLACYAAAKRRREAESGVRFRTGKPLTEAEHRRLQEMDTGEDS